jgi:hypothetical protein
MGIYRTAKWAAPACFLIDSATRIYGMLCSPNLNDTQYQNLSFSSYNLFYYGFFLSATDNLCGVAIPSLEVLFRNPAEGTELDEIMSFVPNYCTCNFCIAGKEFVAEHGQKVDRALRGCMRVTPTDLISPKYLGRSTPWRYRPYSHVSRPGPVLVLECSISCIMARQHDSRANQQRLR